MNDLTTRQSEIFEFIKKEIEFNGYPPTRSEIAKVFGFKSPNAAEDHLKALKKKGVLNIVSGASRGISIVKEEIGIPVIGLVSAGGPILAQENIEKRIPSTQNILSVASELISNNRYYPPCKSRPRFTFLSIIKLFLFWRFKNENIDVVKKIK